MRLRCGVALVSLLLVCQASTAGAVQQFTVSPDPVQIPLATDSETVVAFPEDVVRVLVPSGNVPYDFLPPFGNVIVFQVPEEKRKRLLKSPKPYSLSVVTKKRVQQIVLVPRPGISERIEFTEKKAADADSPFSGESGMDASWLSEPYHRLIRKLIRALYEEVPPKGYRYAKATSDYRTYLASKKSAPLYYEPVQFTSDYRMDLAAVIASDKVVGRRYVVSNVGEYPIQLKEQAFWREGCIAVAIRRHRLLPRTPATERTEQYKTDVYILARRSSAPIGNIGAKVVLGGAR